MKLIIVFLILISHIYAAYAYDGYDFGGYDYERGSYVPSSDYIAIYSSYDSSKGNPMESSSYQSYSYGSGIAKPNSNSLWIQSSTGQLIQSMQCLIFSQVILIADSPGGFAIMREVYPDGQQIQNYYQFQPGYTKIVFAADQPGRHTLSYELNGQLSNIVILDVLSSDRGQIMEGSIGEATPSPGPISLTPLIGNNIAPVLNSLTPDRSSPQVIGNPITWTANAYDSDGDPIYYKFWQAKENNLTGDIWVPMNDWSTENTWTWIPDGEGNYRISVMARDGYHTNSPDGGDSSMVRSFSVIAAQIINPVPLPITPPANQPPIINEFSEEPNSGYRGEPITVSVRATDPNNDQIYYRYKLMGPLPGPKIGSDFDVTAWDISNYRPLTDWITANSWTWTPGRYDGPGEYYIVMVEVRDGHNALDWDDFSEMVITVRDAPAQEETSGVGGIGKWTGAVKTLSKGSKKRVRTK